MTPAPAPGLLLVAKPTGMTSRQAVDVVMRKLEVRRMGHAGTLDPFAEGLLIVLWGRATGLVPYLQEYPKSYRAVIRMGRTTDTQDVTGTVLREVDASRLGADAILAAMGAFRGEIEQVPPRFSAVKHQGRRSYAMARKGLVPEALPRLRRIHRYELLEWAPPLARVFVECSTGTYVRTLGHDLGNALGVGGSLEALERSAIGPFRVEDAIGVERVHEMTGVELLARAVRLADALPDWPTVAVDDEGARDLMNGIPGSLPERAPAHPVRVVDGAGNLLALYRGGEHPGFLRVFVGQD